MKLKNVSSNCSELVLKNGTVLFSYETPVAVSFDLPVGDKWGVYKTEKNFGLTTTKHIRTWTATERALPQHEIEYLAQQIAQA